MEATLDPLSYHQCQCCLSMIQDIQKYYPSTLHTMNEMKMLSIIIINRFEKYFEMLCVPVVRSRSYMMSATSLTYGETIVLRQIQRVIKCLFNMIMLGSTQVKHTNNSTIQNKNKRKRFDDLNKENHESLYFLFGNNFLLKIAELSWQVLCSQCLPSIISLFPIEKKFDNNKTSYNSKLIKWSETSLNIVIHLCRTISMIIKHYDTMKNINDAMINKNESNNFQSKVIPKNAFLLLENVIQAASTSNCHILESLQVLLMDKLKLLKEI